MPTEVRSGGVRVRSVGGYTEVALPDLAPGIPHELVIGPETRAFRPVNRAWLPLGPYLRVGGATIPLPPLPAGGPLAEGPWRWAIYEITDPEQALDLAARGAGLVETMMIGEMLADPRLAGARRAD